MPQSQHWRDPTKHVVRAQRAPLDQTTSVPDPVGPIPEATQALRVIATAAAAGSSNPHLTLARKRVCIAVTPFEAAGTEDALIRSICQFNTAEAAARYKINLSAALLTPASGHMLALVCIVDLPNGALTFDRCL